MFLAVTPSAKSVACTLTHGGARCNSLRQQSNKLSECGWTVLVLLRKERYDVQETSELGWRALVMAASYSLFGRSEP
jgi:hypothetical protein